MVISNGSPLIDPDTGGIIVRCATNEVNVCDSGGKCLGDLMYLTVSNIEIVWG